MKAEKVTVLDKDKTTAIQSGNKVDIKEVNKTAQSENNVEVNKSKIKPVVPFDNRVLPSEEYHRLWCKVIVDFTEHEPILAMCINNANEFVVDKETLKVGFSADTNMLLLEDSENKQIILDKLFENRRRLKTEFYLIEKPVDNTQEKIDRIKGLFDSNILKITKK